MSFGSTGRVSPSAFAHVVLGCSSAIGSSVTLAVTNDPAYAGGETIEVSIRSPYVGAGLITIERDRVLQYKWFKTGTTSSVQRIQVPQAFEGNGYVSVNFPVREGDSMEISCRAIT